MWFTWLWYILSFVWLVASSKVFCAGSYYNQPNIKLDVQCTFDVHLYQLTHHALRQFCKQGNDRGRHIGGFGGHGLHGLSPGRMEIWPFVLVLCIISIMFATVFRQCGIYIYTYIFCWYYIHIGILMQMHINMKHLFGEDLFELFFSAWSNANPSGMYFQGLAASNNSFSFEKSECQNHLRAKSRKCGKIAG